MKNENKSVPCYITEERLSYKQTEKKDKLSHKEIIIKLKADFSLPLLLSPPLPPEDSEVIFNMQGGKKSINLEFDTQLNYPLISLQAYKHGKTQISNSQSDNYSFFYRCSMGLK